MPVQHATQLIDVFELVVFNEVPVNFRLTVAVGKRFT
jgi:hypothetical protein